MEDPYWGIVFVFILAPFLAAFGRRLPKWVRYGLAVLLVLAVLSAIIWLILG